MKLNEALERIEYIVRSSCPEAGGSNIGDCNKCLRTPCDGMKALLTITNAVSADRPHGEWIPITYRPMDEDEYRTFGEEYGYLPVEERKVFACQMPEDGQEILISTKYGHIFLDTCVYEDSIYGLEEYGLEEYGDWEDVLAWMPLPEPYKKEGDEK